MQRKADKNRLGGKHQRFSKSNSKMFERDLIAVYKLFAEKRPAEMNSDDSPFYLTAKNLKKLESLSNNAWFIKKPHPVLTN